nr:MAG TPA: hypothetical protein [Caudoviricetes sp.]
MIGFGDWMAGAFLLLDWTQTSLSFTTSRYRGRVSIHQHQTGLTVSLYGYSLLLRSPVLPR